ncbi:13584_t:CDS:2, partial [Funneliformis caledonium]
NKEDSVNEDLVDEETDEEYMLNEDVPVDLFTVPNFDDFDDEPSLQTDNYDDSWILLWIFKYQRELYKLKDQPDDVQNKQARRKYKNSQRSELHPLKIDNRYYSPDDSKTDTEYQTSKRKLITKNLKWRSLTTQIFLREYIDKLFDETSKVLKKRKHSYSNQYASEKVPSNAPR